MSNKVAASMTASIIIDKKEVISSALDAYALAKKEIDGNKLELLIDVSDEQALKRLKEIQQELSGKDYIIRFKNQGIDETLKSLDELYEKIKNIISGKNFGSGKGIGNSIVDEKTIENALQLFTKVEGHLVELRKTISDVGDGDEFSPLLKMIKEVSDSISALSESMSKIKLNLNVDLGATNEEKLSAKVAQANHRQLEAYRKLFSSMKASGKTNMQMLKFFEPDDASVSELIGIYRDLIQKIEKEVYGKRNLKAKNIFKEEYKEIENARAAFNRANKSQEKTSPLGELFGGTDLTEVIKQLESIAEKLGDISSVATEFKNSFQNGFNVIASVEEIEKLTNKVKELEDELSKLKTPSTPPVETNISSPIKDTSIKKDLSNMIDSANKLDDVLEQIDIPKESFDEVISKFGIIEDKAQNIAKITKQMHREGKDNRPVESYNITYKNGSNEIYGESSKPQLLRSNDVLYNVKESETKIISEQKEKYEELNRAIDRYITVRKRIARGEALSSDEEEAKGLLNIISELNKTDVISEEQHKNAQNRLNSLETSIKDIVALTKTSSIDKMQSKVDALNKRYNQINSNKPNKENRNDNYQKAINNYGEAINNLQIHLDKLRSSDGAINEKDIEEWQRLSVAVEEASNNLKTFGAAEKGSSVHSREKEIDKITKYLEANTRISKEAKVKLNDYLNLLRNGDASVNVQEIHTEWTKVAVAEREAGREGKAFFDILQDKTLYGYAARLANYYLSLTDFVRYGKAAVDNIIEINTAQTELRKVSNATGNRLVENFKTSAEAAKDLGATVTDVISATADWSRMGYSVDDAEELARISTLYKNVGDGIDIEAANNSLISTLQGFQLTADEAESVIDKFNEVANNFAIDSAGIGEALQRSAASFNAANTDLSKSIALITATNEVVQDPDSVGTLWKTMSARIRGASTELSELGEETDEYTESTSKLRDLVMSLTGFDIMLDENTFKDIYEIILGIGKEWNKLTDLEQAKYNCLYVQKCA